MAIIYHLLAKGETLIPAELASYHDGVKILSDRRSTPVEARPQRAEAIRALKDGARVYVARLADLFATVCEAHAILSEARGVLTVESRGERRLPLNLSDRNLDTLALLAEAAELEAQGRALPVAEERPRGGRAPYGWVWASGRLIPNRREARVLAKIEELRADKRTWAEVARELNAARMRRRNDAPWTENSARRAWRGAKSRNAEELAGEAPR